MNIAQTSSLAASGLSKKLWAPSLGTLPETGTHRLLSKINNGLTSAAKERATLSSYHDLWSWSTENISDFWELVWEETRVVGDMGTAGAGVNAHATPASNPTWFPQSKLNWAENMLQPEPTPSSPNPPYRSISYGDLYELVERLVSSLLSSGVRPGDRVASYSSNCIENIAASLAAAAIGAIWVSVSADFGPDAALSRFQQVQPKIIFSVDEVVYNAKVHPHLPKLATLLSELRSADAKTVVISSLGNDSSQQKEWNSDWTSWDAFLNEGEGTNLGKTSNGEIDWWRGPFDWPLWILFSSGTTNKPKPIVHRAGGMLLQSKKEFVICADLKEDDVFFYYTTTGWMMWNFLVNALSVGCTLVLYDGSPLRDPALLWKMAEELKFTIFGTSAKYLDQLSKGYKPAEHHDLSSLKQVYSTGSPLASHLFDYVYESISPNVILSSITGGTDICSLFAGMSTALPVFQGEIQCRMPGMAVYAYSSEGVPVEEGQSGELVCTKPFPCQPLGFWPLPGYGSDEDVAAAQERYRQSYFDEFKDIWYHGDHVLITPSREGNGGGLVMLGRSDGVLNPSGIRFGSSEIYDVLESRFGASKSTPQSEVILDSLVVGQSIQGGTDERVVLFVYLPEGQTLSQELIKKIKTEIRSRRTARHVPEVVVQVSDIPYTLNAKKVEVPVKKILNGVDLNQINLTTLRNPESLAEYVAIRDKLKDNTVIGRL
ncbi:hypothetical protein FRC02_010183 [Tulasnella sp. 418]|nr:hypothetical protein FRC02_010183 [Tulasnella sp. 418]